LILLHQGLLQLEQYACLCLLIKFLCLIYLFRHIIRTLDRKSTRLNSSHVSISYAVFCLKKKIIYLFYISLFLLDFIYFLLFFSSFLYYSFFVDFICLFSYFFFFLIIPLPPFTSLFPYTTLFRSC